MEAEVPASTLQAVQEVMLEVAERLDTVVVQVGNLMEAETRCMALKEEAMALSLFNTRLLRRFN